MSSLRLWPTINSHLMSLFLCPGRRKKSLPGRVSTVTAPPITRPVVLHLPHHPCHFERKTSRSFFTCAAAYFQPFMTTGSPSAVPLLRLHCSITIRSEQVCNMRPVWAETAAHLQLMKTQRWKRRNRCCQPRIFVESFMSRKRNPRVCEFLPRGDMC